MSDIFGAIEVCIEDPDSLDVILCGIEPLKEVSELHKKMVESQVINDFHRFENFFGFNEKEKFHYTIYSLADDKILNYEKGIGYCYQKDGKSYLKRFTPRNKGTNPNFSCRVRPNSKYNFQGKTIVTSSLPSDFSQMLCCDNNIISSKHCSTPICIEIEPFSLLGRLNQNIHSLSIEDKDFIDILLRGISKHKNQISLKTSKLSAPVFSTKEIQLQHNDGNKAKKNTLVYDEDLDVIKFFDGNKWRKLKWEEDASQE